MTIHLPAETAMALALALTDTRYDLHAKRTAAEKAIEDLINFLDDTEGDPDLEPWLAGGGGPTDDREGDLDTFEGEELDATPGFHSGESDGDCDDEPTLGSIGSNETRISQQFWSQGSARGMDDDAEHVNEDGGDILDVPHDADDDAEPDLTFNFGKGCASSESDGPCDSEGKDQRDRPAASLMAAKAMRMARAKAVA